MDDDLKNNLSTIAVILYGVLAPYLAQYLTAEQFSALFIAICGVMIICYSACHPNTMPIFGNGKKDECTCSNEGIILNEEYTLDPTDDDDGGA